MLNKVDTVVKSSLLALTTKINERVKFAQTFMISALNGSGCKDLLHALSNMMQEGPWYYPEDQISDMPMRHLAAEITREKLFFVFMMNCLIPQRLKPKALKSVQMVPLKLIKLFM